MASTREMRLRIRSVKNIAQVTHALETVSASKVRKAVAAVQATRPYATKAWQVLTHIARQPGRANLHPLLMRQLDVRNVLVVLISSDRGLAGAYNSNIVRSVIHYFAQSPVPVQYITVGRKGRDMLLRRRKQIIADFSNLPAAVLTFLDVSAISHLIVDEFLNGNADEIYLAYTDFVSMTRQETKVKKILPLEIDNYERVQAFEHQRLTAAYIYEPDEREILDNIIPRFTALQIYQAILEAQASENAARMFAMQNATDNAVELIEGLTLEYNKKRQQSITNEMLDLAGGTEALAAQ